MNVSRIPAWLLIAVAGSAAAQSGPPAEQRKGADSRPPGETSRLVEIQVSTLRLRAAATVTGGVVRLTDVLDFSEADPRLADSVGAADAGVAASPPATVELTHAQVSRRLAELGVNASRVLLRGALACRVSLIPPAAAPESAQTVAQADALLRGPPRTADDPSQATTLGEALRRYVLGELGESGRAELVFEQAAGDFLTLTSPPFEFSIHAPRTPRLGLREFRVIIRRNGRVYHTLQIAAEVRLVRRVVVASRALNVGMYLTRDSVELAERVFAEDSQLGYDRPEPVLGQRVARFVPAGQMLTPADVEAVELVRRSRPVTVQTDGAISVRTSGIALDSGGYGDVVRVRLGEHRRDRREVRGVVVGAGTVRISEGGT